MAQETAFLAALQGAALVESRGTTLNLTDRKGMLQVSLQRPHAAPEASASPTPSATAGATATTKPTATPTATPEPTPKPTATAAPTPKPTATPAPTPKPTAAPTQSPPVTVPATATCKLTPVGGPVVATIVYPGTWSTVKEPPELACRYFDPEPITVPADPATLDTAVRADLLATPYQDALAAATDPATWTVATRTEVNVQGAAVTCIGAIAASESAGIAVGDASYACLANVQTAGTVVIRAVGTPGDPALMAESAVVTLMTLASTFTPPG
jgi:hypothetical protein